MPITVNVGGKRIKFPNNASKAEKLRAIREQQPELYREVILGEGSEEFRNARQAGFRQAAEATSAPPGSNLLARARSAQYAGLLGAGRTLQSLTQGVRSLFNPEGAAEAMEGDPAIMGALREERPIATFAGESVPYFAIPGNLATGAASRLASTALGRSTAGQTVGRFSGKLASKVGEKTARNITGIADDIATGAALGAAEYDNTALAGATGGVLGSIAGRTLFARNPSSPDLGNVAREAGLTPSPAARFPESIAVRKFQDWLETPWFHSGRGRRLRDKNQATLNNSLREAFLLPENAKLDKIGLGEVAENSSRAFSVPLADARSLRARLGEIEEASREYMISGREISAQRSPFRRAIGQLKKDGGLSPENLKKLTFAFADEADSKGYNPSVRTAFRKGYEAIMNEVEKQRGPAIADSLRAAVQRRLLAKEAKRHIRPDGSIAYDRLLESIHGSKILENRSDIGQQLFAARATGTAGRIREDARPFSIPGRILGHTSGLLGGTAGAFAGVPMLGAVAGEVAPRAAAHALYDLGGAAMIDRGLLGGPLGLDVTRAVNPAAERIGQSLGIMMTGDPEDVGY